MNSEEFVRAIKLGVRDGCVSGLIRTLERPPGRRPDAQLVADSQWYLTLDPEHRVRLQSILTSAVDQAIFSFFCALDGVSAIENGPEKGRLELRYIGAESSSLLNSEGEEMLHDLYNAECQAQ